MQHSTRALLALAVMGLATMVFAQNQQASEPAGTPVGGAAGAPAAQEGRDDTTYSLSAGVAHQFDTDIDDSDGEFSLTRYGLGAGVRYPLRDTAWSFDHGILYERDEYGSDLSWSVDSLSYALRVGYKLDEHWSFFAGPLIGISAEEGANWGDALRYGAIVGATYRFSPRFTLGLGVAAVDDIGDDTSVFPTILVDAQITDEVRLRNARPQPGLRGTGGLEVVCTAVPDWEFALGGAYDSRRFLLDERIAGDDLVAENNSIPLFFRISYKPAEEWTISALAGVLVGGELTVESDEGDELGDTDYDTAPFVGLGVSWRN